MRGRLFAFLAVVALTAGILPACERIDRNMWDSPAFKPQEEPVRLPPKDSVPTKGKERVPPPREAAKLVNPVQPTEGALLKGKELYGIFCVPCHGVSGKGDGPVGKKYVPSPVALRSGSPAVKPSDGELFAVISNGSGGMPAFRADLA
ncbi:MAG: cytochrome c, partial [Candidatus Deferrimicrobiota bacterium]